MIIINNTLYKDKEWLYKKYWTENLSERKIAKLCEAGGVTIHNWMVKLNIPRREHVGKGKNNWNWQGGEIKAICEWCGKSYTIGRYRKNKTRFCSNKCRYEWISKNITGLGNPMYLPIMDKRFKGKSNPNWKGGVTSFHSQIRNCFEYRQWRSDVFTRDKYTCQICGDDRGGNLQAHHKTAFINILNKYEITTFEEALKCEALWNINNGITLCEECHKEFHR